MKFVYAFNEGNKDMKDILGGKGANLAEMSKLNIPVPQGFTITTTACNNYYENEETLSEEIEKQIYEAVSNLERKTGKLFGSTINPLLLSVRSGARVSMPGMMDTVLNLGLNDEITRILAITNKRFAYDSYRRLIQMFADVVKGYPKKEFEKVIDEMKIKKNVKLDIELDAEDMCELAMQFKDIYKEYAHEEFPQDAKVQLIEAVKAVFKSWNTERAIYYRKMNEIPDDWGTAVNVQQMVYGNLNDKSGTGVAFTRNPATGENKIYGEYLLNAQGEDIVAGIRTPHNIEELKSLMPNIYEQFNSICKILETHYKDMQDMEFTIENGKLYMLQTRSGKRTAEAALKIALDLLDEGMITKEECILRVDANELDQLLHPTFDTEELKNGKVIAKGLATSPGAGTGKIYFSAEDAKKAHDNGEDVILVRLETSPEDIEGMNSSNGILTIRGGMTSHAAVVARGMGKCCISGCGELVIDEANKTITTQDKLVLKEGDYISLDGSTGLVYQGKIKTKDISLSGNLERFMNMADGIRHLGVRANADTPKDAKMAKMFGAEGIGLCRTEHMFFEKERIFAIRQMILAETVENRRKALNKLLSMQRSDFEEIFREMDSSIVTIRYLDPPLHEFLPKEEAEIKYLAMSLGIDVDKIKERISYLKEFNPMMGHRGCRLDITYPEIAIMQTRAVIEAAINVSRENIKVHPEIMIPLISDIKELRYVKNIIVKTAERVMQENNMKIDYKIGTMIEVPRAVLIAGKIAKEVDFFSFGTNDLTQLTYGFSRDDASKFLKDYYDKKILDYDPFKRIDEEGVGTLVDTAISLAKKANPKLEFGICGEHGGEPHSVEFFNKINLTYVSCSTYRIPIARLAAAQASIKLCQK